MPTKISGPTEKDLRAHYGQPSKLPAKAFSDRLEEHSRRFIELSPLVVIASTDGDNNIDISPRGDAPGFVTIADDQTLIIPDRKGNNKIDTLRNVAHVPKMGLMFVIPGINEVLRLRGTAEISLAPDERAQHAVQGAAPKSVLIFTIQKIFPHCGKAFIRAQLWDENVKRDRPSDVVPSLAQIALAMADMDAIPVEEADAKIEQDYKNTLY